LGSEATYFPGTTEKVIISHLESDFIWIPAIPFGDLDKPSAHGRSSASVQKRHFHTELPEDSMRTSF
jgi:hypothetical protein